MVWFFVVSVWWYWFGLVILFCDLWILFDGLFVGWVQSCYCFVFRLLHWCVGLGWLVCCFGWVGGFLFLFGFVWLID